jgi:hypothetical protein
MSLDVSTRAQFESELNRYLGSVLKGSTPLAAFINWFNSFEWEDRIAPDSAAERVCFGIENILYQIEAFPDDVDRDALRTELDLLQQGLRLGATVGHVGIGQA